MHVILQSQDQQWLQQKKQGPCAVQYWDYWKKCLMRPCLIFKATERTATEWEASLSQVYSCLRLYKGFLALLQEVTLLSAETRR